MRTSASARGGRETKGRPSPPAEQLPAAIYAQLRQIAQRIMHGESPGHTLQPTAQRIRHGDAPCHTLERPARAHEAFLRVAGRREALALSETHLRALFAQAMRHILVDHARRKKASKRGGQRIRVALDEKLVSAASEEDLLDLDAILTKLAELDPAQAQLVELRIFGGMTVAEAAAEMGVPKRTAEREWTAAKAWLRRDLPPAVAHASERHQQIKRLFLAAAELSPDEAAAFLALACGADDDL